MYASFFIRFLLFSIALSLLIIGILLVKRFLKHHISDWFHYYIWFILLFMLAVPFVPAWLFVPNTFSHWLASHTQFETLTASLSALQNTPQHIADSTIWQKDFSVSAHHSLPNILNIITLSVWLVGMAAMVILTFLSNQKVSHIRKTADPSTDTELTFLFHGCKREIGIHRPIALYISSSVTTPITFGFLHPCIILPDTILSDLSTKDIRYIFLHELQHYKRKDIFTNYAMCLFHIIYWFHPLVWYAFKEMRIDREIACDVSVLKMLDENCYAEYGNTIINFADKYLRSFTFSFASGMSGSKKQIKKRIIKIASFQGETLWTKIKSIAVFTLIGTIVFSSVPMLSFGTYEKNNFVPARSQTTYEDLSTYFGSYSGSFVLYDSASDQYSVFNKVQSEKRISPDSTFKIYSALFALEEQNITKENSLLSWDGTNYPFDEWNHNQDLPSAMKNSTNWYFQTLDKKLGMTKLQSYFKRIDYGNLDFSSGLSDYWLESSLKISPIEQVKLLKNFYSNSFKFKDENVQTVKDALLLSESNGTRLYGKTGTGAVNGKNVNGWFIGYTEKNGNTYFFAVNIQGQDNCKGSAAAKIGLSILNDKKIYSSN